MQVHATILTAIIDVDWAWKSDITAMLGPSTAPSGSVLEFDLGCAFGASLHEKVYFLLAYPAVAACITFTFVVCLCKCSASFKSIRTTLWLFASVGLYTFAPAFISDLFIAFPCYDGVEEKMMVHDPTTKCLEYPSLVVLSVLGICIYSAASVYVLGYVFWKRKDIIQTPARHATDVVESTYKAFGFLFHGPPSNLAC